LDTVPGQRSYPFSAISLAGLTGVQGVLNVRAVWIFQGSGSTYINPDSFESFSLYNLNNLDPTPGLPTVWAQYGQGALGSIVFDPVPSTAWQVQLDCVVYPIPLVDDTTVEIIPYLWTDAVPYFAAYLALLSAQTGIRTQEADAMFKRYQEFVARARRAATPAAVPWLFEQTQIPGGISPQPQGQR
jgi:hypothetical protein